MNNLIGIENAAFFKLSYGLFILTAKDGDKDNGCIINTVTQITDTPKRISVAVNKNNFTHDMILKTGIFTVSVLSTETPFYVFQHFGFQSGRNVDKFAGAQETKRSANGILYESRYANSFISGKIISTSDYGTHTLFIADVTEAAVLSAAPSLTYQYYFDHIKPKPDATVQAAPSKKKRYVCKICGYVYEGDELPPDFVCPICKHGASDFEEM
jgi:flavin reductase (DIM6/NTAB) family NADH-FMN oxidoreductase RutF/rubredoxin